MCCHASAFDVCVRVYVCVCVCQSSSSKVTPNALSNLAKSAQNMGRPKGFTDKDWLIERYLVRWWYCEEWPPADRPKPDDPSEDFVEMEQYPYMYLNENTGQVINKRNKESLPPCKEVCRHRPQETCVHHWMVLCFRMSYVS